MMSVLDCRGKGQSEHDLAVELIDVIIVQILSQCRLERKAKVDCKKRQAFADFKRGYGCIGSKEVCPMTSVHTYLRYFYFNMNVR